MEDFNAPKSLALQRGVRIRYSGNGYALKMVIRSLSIGIGLSLPIVGSYCDG